MSPVVYHLFRVFMRMLNLGIGYKHPFLLVLDPTFPLTTLCNPRLGIFQPYVNMHAHPAKRCCFSERRFRASDHLSTVALVVHRLCISNFQFLDLRGRSLYSDVQYPAAQPSHSSSLQAAVNIYLNHRSR